MANDNQQSKTDNGEKVMPKMRTYGSKRIGINCRNVEMWYGTDENIFYYVVPDEISNITKGNNAFAGFIKNVRIRGKDFGGTQVVFGHTEDELEKNLKEFNRIYTNIATKRRKVIIWKIHYESKKYEDHRQFRSHRDAENIRPSAKMKYNYYVAMEVNTANELIYQSEDGKMEFERISIENLNKRYEVWKVIDHTPEAEAFFKSIYSGMEDLMGKMEKYIGNAKKATKAIEVKQALLPAPETKE